METELKFEVEPAVAAKLRQNVLMADGDGREQALRSIYFDTPDFGLRDAGIALRVREGGGKRVQTIKTGGDGFSRGEWESEVAAMAPDFGAAGDSPLGEALSSSDRDRVRPVFEVRVDRAAREVQIDGGVVEMALDRGQVIADGRGSPVCELELELKSGAIAALFELARNLSGDAVLDLAFASKAERGYALLDGVALAARPSVPIGLDRKGDAGQAFKAIAAGALSQIAGNARVLRAARRPEAVHQLRVGLRRLRSALSLFTPMLAADARFEDVKADLKWMTHELDEARNLDVFIAHTFRRAARDRHSAPGLGSFGESLLSAQTRAYDDVEAAVHSARFRSLMLETAAWVQTGAWTGVNDEVSTAARNRPITAFAADIFTRDRRKIDNRAKRLERLSTEARHKLRIKAKTLRYACEFFASLYDGKQARRNAAFGAVLADFQDALGALNDIAVSEGLAARVVGANGSPAGGRARSDLQRAFIAGSVTGQARPHEAKLMKAACKARDALAEAKAFWA